MNPWIVDVLRSPAGARVSVEPNRAIDVDGREYRVENGVVFLHDVADVAPQLKADRAAFERAFRDPSVRHPDWEGRWAAYSKARAVNTDFMFSALAYENPASRIVCEIGVGACDLVRRFSLAGLQTVAVDFFPWQMEAAHREALAAGEPGFACISAPMARLPFADASLDMVYFHAALHHALPRKAEDFAWSDPVNLVDTLREVRRVLKPNGIFLLLGEGIYPEDVSDRIHERQYRAGERRAYEAWYKISEYEAAYRAAGIAPHLFLWQDALVVSAIAYGSGGRAEIIRPSDGIAPDTYARIGTHLRQVQWPQWVTVQGD